MSPSDHTVETVLSAAAARQSVLNQVDVEGGLGGFKLVRREQGMGDRAPLNIEAAAAASTTEQRKIRHPPRLARLPAREGISQVRRVSAPNAGHDVIPALGIVLPRVA